MIWTNLVLLLGAAATAWTLGLVSEHLGRKLNLVDAPGGALKIHQRATPRFGGFAVIVSLWLVHLAGSFAGSTMFTLPELATATLLFALGTWDDFKPRQALSRLALQVLIFMLSWAWGVRIATTGLFWLDAGVSLFLFIVVINSVNFFDGMDGLLTLTAACALLVWAAVAAESDVVWLPFATSAALLLGFLPRNWHPARTFLGDGGSFVVGFLFYLVFVRSPAPGAQMFTGFWVVALPLCDAVAATVDRLRRHGNVFAGDRDHVYDMLGRLGMSAPQVALLLSLVAAIAARGTSVVASLPTYGAAAATVVLYMVLVVAILAMRRRFRQGGHSVIGSRL